MTWIPLGGTFKRPRPLATPIIVLIVSYSDHTHGTATAVMLLLQCQLLK